MEEFNNNSMKKKWFPKKPKAGKHAKRTALIAGAVIVVRIICHRLHLSDPGTGAGSAFYSWSSKSGNRNRSSF